VDGEEEELRDHARRRLPLEGRARADVDPGHRALTVLLAALLATLVPAFVADSAIQSTGNGFAWTTAAGDVRVSDARGRTLHDVRPGEGCASAGASRARVVVIACDGGSFLLDTETGAVTPHPLPAAPRAIGFWWIATAGGTYVNWRTGAQRTAPGGRDLDDPGLGPARLPYRLRERGRAIDVRRGDHWRAAAVCRGACGDIEVWRRRLAYVDPAGGVLVERRPRHLRRWRLPAALRTASLHRAGNALVLQRGAQVWRAPR
jgi:hypothetical protein